MTHIAIYTYVKAKVKGSGTFSNNIIILNGLISLYIVAMEKA